MCLTHEIITHCFTWTALTQLPESIHAANRLAQYFRIVARCLLPTNDRSMWVAVLPRLAVLDARRSVMHSALGPASLATGTQLVMSCEFGRGEGGTLPVPNALLHHLGAVSPSDPFYAEMTAAGAVMVHLNSAAWLREKMVLDLCGRVWCPTRELDRLGQPPKEQVRRCRVLVSPRCHAEPVAVVTGAVRSAMSAAARNGAASSFTLYFD